MFWFAGLVIFLSLLIWGAQFRWPSFLAANIKKIYLFFVFLCFGYSGLLTYLQYGVWKNSSAMKFVLPPFSGFGYFIKYCFFNFWSVYLFSLILSLVFILVADYFNKKHPEKFFREGEIRIAALALLISGYPGVIFYLLVFILLFLLASASTAIFRGREHRLSPYYLWLPAAICVILASVSFLDSFSLWRFLKI